MSLPKWIDPKVTLGNLVTLVITLIFLGMAYQKLTDTIGSVQGDIITITKKNEQQDFRIEAMRDIATTRQESIVSRLARIEALLENINREQPRSLQKAP